MRVGFLLIGLALAVPATAQQAGPALPGATRARSASSGPGEVPKRAPVNGVLVLYGNERCPINDQGEEIVICERRSAQEQYRMPKELRELVVTPENESWAAKAKGTLTAGAGTSTIDSCSAVGSGGQSGCFAQQANAYAQARKARAVEAERAP